MRPNNSHILHRFPPPPVGVSEADAPEYFRIRRAVRDALAADERLRSEHLAKLDVRRWHGYSVNAPSPFDFSWRRR
jgi:hypothetical protein